MKSFTIEEIKIGDKAETKKCFNETDVCLLYTSPSPRDRG